MKSDPFDDPGNARVLLRTIGWIGALMLLVGLFWTRFDLVIDAEGVVTAKNSARIYAPRAGIVEEFLVSPGQSVQAGELLIRLRDENLEQDIHRLGDLLETARAEARLAENRLREIELTGGSLEARAAEQSLTLHREKEALLNEIASMYDRLQQTGSVSMMERLTLSSQQLGARREALRDETLLALKEEGYIAILQDRHIVLRDAALARVSQLEAQKTSLLAAAERLHVKAPFAGFVTNLFVRDVGERVEAGTLLLGLADPSGGYEVRMFVPDRNVDLIRPGVPVRMASAVFSPSTEGYLFGSVQDLIADERAREPRGFEVRVRLERWPVTPVIGSRVKAEILLQRQGLADLLRPNNLRQPNEERQGSDGPR